MAWLQLARIALFPTIVWDFYVGMLLLGLSWSWSLGYALAALLLLYHGGMMLNDLRDIAEDRQAARCRPLVDGRIRPLAAAPAIFVTFLGALVCAVSSGPQLFSPSIWLLGMVLFYNLSGQSLRNLFGPALLGAARAFSLCFGSFAVYGLHDGWMALGLAPLCTYALYFLFLARLARTEEEGIWGMRGFSFLLMAAAAPGVLLFDGQCNGMFLLGWIFFTVYLLRPAWAVRARSWDSEQVRCFVRHALGSAPLVLSLVLMADTAPHNQWQAVFALPVCLSVRMLARHWTPE